MNTRCRQFVLCPTQALIGMGSIRCRGYRTPERLIQTNVFSSFPERPKGMQWAIYDHLRARGEAADRQTIDLIAQYLERRPIQATKRS